MFSLRYPYSNFLLIVLIYYRKEFLEIFKNKTILKILLLNGVLISIHMLFFMKGLSLSSSFTGSVFVTMGFPISMLVAAFFFKEERSRILSPYFLFSLLISLCGAIFFLLSNGDISNIFDSPSTKFFIITLFTQALHGILIKKLSHHMPLIVLGTITSILVAFFLGMMAIITGSWKELYLNTPQQIIELIIAGIYGMVVGMILGFGIIKRMGIAMFNIFQLIIPIVTAIVGYVWLKETITLNQLIGSILILVGVYFSFKAKIL